MKVHYFQIKIRFYIIFYLYANLFLVCQNICCCVYSFFQKILVPFFCAICKRFHRLYFEQFNAVQPS